MDELAVAKAIAAGDATSPQRYGNLWLFAIRITGTGLAYRLGRDEFCWRDPEHYLNDEFLERCNGLPVIWQHPPEKPSLDDAEFKKRTIGTTFLPYIKGDEVWAVVKIYDDDAAEVMANEQISTSPAVVFNDASGNETVEIDGKTLLIEGKPALLDHIAVCDVGVWDKGLDPKGVLNDTFQQEPIGMTEEAKKDGAEEARNDVSAKLDAIADALSRAHARLDAMERKDEEEKERKDAQARKDAEEKERKDAAARKDEEEKEERKDSEEEKERKDGALPVKDAKASRKDESEKEEEEEEEEKEEKKERKDAESFEKWAKEEEKESDHKKDSAKARKDGEDEPKEEKEKPVKDSARQDTARHDAQMDALKRELAELKARFKPMSDEEVRQISATQARADGIAGLFGKRASAPIPGEDPISYRRRVANEFKQYSTKFKNKSLAGFDSDVLSWAEDEIYADAAKAAHSPDRAGNAGVLIPIVETDAAGRKITKWTGDNLAWMQHFMTGAQVGRIRRPRDTIWE